jgi:subtilisin-like proprotein convertase family protein
MRTIRLWLLAAVCTTGLVLAVPPAVGAPPPTTGGLSAKAQTQIEALAEAKAARSPAENKVDSPLLTAVQLLRGRLPAAARSVRPGVRTDRAGRVGVEIQGAVTADLLGRITALGGVLRSADRAAGAVRADVPLAAVQPLAALPQVRHLVSLAAAFTTSGDPRTSASSRTSASTQKPASTQDSASPAQRPQQLRLRVAAALRAASRPSAVAATAPMVVSEGDAAHGAKQAREQLGVSGVGITVGVLSDGVDSLAASVASGELPPNVRVLPGAEGVGDEGTAMLEIVHDLAPKANLAFATAANGVESFADNIRALRAAGADVIVDDILYFVESPFQDGPIARAVLDVTGDGALYVSSSGNDGNVTAGTSGSYEDTFRSSGRTIGKFAGLAHDFDPGGGVQQLDPLSAGSAGQPVVLHWADPLGAARDDYDLYVLDSADNVVGFSNTTQNGDDDPLEGLFLPAATGLRIAVTRFAGEDRYFQVSAFRGRFRTDGALRGFAVPGVTRGHSAVPTALSVAAVPAAGALPFDLEPGDPPNPNGPFPGVYTATQRSERFTSDGPRRMFFTPRGAPLTPGNLTATGGVVRRKPDLAAADGVRTSVAGFAPFFGTSASAAHVAGLAALVLSGRPGISAKQVRSALTKTALDLERPGRDDETGAGVLQIGAALRSVGAAAQPYVVAGRPRVTRSSDGDAFLEPGETALVSVPVTNAGDSTAAGASVTVTSTTPDTVVRPAIKPYGTVRAGATKAHSFRVTLPSTAPLGSRASLSVRVRFTGGFSPQSARGSLPVGQPSTSVVTARLAGRDLPIPDADPAGVTAPLEVRGVGPVSKVTFSVDGTDCSNADASTTVGLQHTYVRDLVGTLHGPDGTAVTLFSQAGGDGNNLCQAVFADSAAVAFENVSSTAAPFTGTWRPAERLAAFVGRPGDGTWRFSVADLQRSDVGVLRAVSVHVSGFVPPSG